MIQLIKLGILVACFSAAACMNTTNNNSMTKDTQTQGAAGNLDANQIGAKASSTGSPSATSIPATATPH